MLSKSRLKFLVLISLLFLNAHPLQAQKVVLRLIGPEDVNGAWVEIIRRFEARHPEVRIKYISGPWSTDDRENMYLRSFLSRDSIEIVYTCFSLALSSGGPGPFLTTMASRGGHHSAHPPGDSHFHGY